MQQRAATRVKRAMWEIKNFGDLGIDCASRETRRAAQRRQSGPTTARPGDPLANTDDDVGAVGTTLLWQASTQNAAAEQPLQFVVLAPDITKVTPAAYSPVETPDVGELLILPPVLAPNEPCRSWWIPPGHRVDPPCLPDDATPLLHRRYSGLNLLRVAPFLGVVSLLSALSFGLAPLAWHRSRRFPQFNARNRIALPLCQTPNGPSAGTGCDVI
jgi:hypothetical protein